MRLWLEPRPCGAKRLGRAWTTAAKAALACFSERRADHQKIQRRKLMMQKDFCGKHRSIPFKKQAKANDFRTKTLNHLTVTQCCSSQTRTLFGVRCTSHQHHRKTSPPTQCLYHDGPNQPALQYLNRPTSDGKSPCSHQTRTQQHVASHISANNTTA